MIHFIFILLNVSFLTLKPSISRADVNINGVLTIENSYYFFIPNGSSQKLQIYVSDPVVRTRLSCLQEGDSISGTSDRLSQDKLTLTAINYVGLTQLIGSWKNSDSIFNFVDYKTFYFTDLTKNNKSKSSLYYHYALSPYGDEYQECHWKIFIMDAVNVILGTLEWTSDNKLRIETYDRDTGEINKSHELFRSSVF